MKFGQKRTKADFRIVWILGYENGKNIRILPKKFLQDILLYEMEMSYMQPMAFYGKILIFYTKNTKIQFWLKFRFLPKIWSWNFVLFPKFFFVVSQSLSFFNFDFLPTFQFCQKFRILPKNFDFCPKFRFFCLPKLSFLPKNVDFFFDKISIFCQSFNFVSTKFLPKNKLRRHLQIIEILGDILKNS